MGKTFSSEPLLYTTTALLQPTKKVVSQLRPDGTMHYYTKKNKCTTRITDDGSCCISLSADGIIELYDLQNKRSQLIRTGCDISSAWEPLLTRDKSLLIVPGATDKSLHIIDPYKKSILQTLMCDGSIINAVEDHGSKRLYVAYGMNQRCSTENFCLTIIDLSTLSIKEDIKKIKFLDNHHSNRTKITVDAHGEKIVFGDCKSLLIYDIKSRSILDLCKPSQGISGTDCDDNATEIDFHPQQNYMAFCNAAGQVFEYDLRNDSRNWWRRPLYKGYSIAYDKMGNGLICGGAEELCMLDNEGYIDYHIESPDLGNVQSVYLNKDSDTWFASTSQNILLAGTLSVLKQKKDREKQESDRRADYDALMEQFRKAYVQKLQKTNHGTWTTAHENEFQEIENELRNLGLELGINDFDQE